MGMFGGTIDWFLRNIMKGSSDIGKMNEAASEIEPGCNGVQFYPNLAGERTPFWNPKFAGTVTGLHLEHRAEHLFRGIMEASGYAVRKIMDNGSDCGIIFEEVTAIGGGAQSDLWLQIKADITGKTFWSSQVSEATMIGSAMLCMLSEGRTVEEIPIIPIKQGYFSRTAEQEKYMETYQIYMKNHDLIKMLYM